MVYMNYMYIDLLFIYLLSAFSIFDLFHCYAIISQNLWAYDTIL